MRSSAGSSTATASEPPEPTSDDALDVAAVSHPEEKVEAVIAAEDEHAPKRQGGLTPAESPVGRDRGPVSGCRCRGQDSLVVGPVGVGQVLHRSPEALLENLPRAHELVLEAEIVESGEGPMARRVGADGDAGGGHPLESAPVEQRRVGVAEPESGEPRRRSAHVPGRDVEGGRLAVVPQERERFALEVGVGVVEGDPHRPPRKRLPAAASGYDILWPDRHPAACPQHSKLSPQAIGPDCVASHRGVRPIDDPVVEKDGKHVPRGSQGRTRWRPGSLPASR